MHAAQNSCSCPILAYACGCQWKKEEQRREEEERKKVEEGEKEEQRREEEREMEAEQRRLEEKVERETEEQEGLGWDQFEKEAVEAEGREGRKMEILFRLQVRKCHTWITKELLCFLFSGPTKVIVINCIYSM